MLTAGAQRPCGQNWPDALAETDGSVVLPILAAGPRAPAIDIRNSDHSRMDPPSPS